VKKHAQRSTKRLLGYARVSTTEQRDEGVSLPAQRARIAAFAAAQGQQLLGIEEDVLSGAIDPARRPGLCRALRAVRSGAADGLVVVRFDRLGRRTLDVLKLAAEADKRGWQLVSIHEQLDTSTAIGGLVMTMLAALAEMERRQISERTRAGMAQVAREGRARSHRLPFGYRIDGEPRATTLRAGDRRKLVQHPGEQALLLRIEQLRCAGLGGHAIATRLNAAGSRNPRTRRPWTASGMKNLLRTAALRRA
jgi:site-specific DNA recombinase